MVVNERAVEALVMQLRESRSADVWQKCAGCMMVLAANSDKVKSLAGAEGAIPELTNIIRKADANKQVLKAALGALAVLSSDERNLGKLRGELGGIELDRYLREKDEKTVTFVKQVLARLYPDQAG